MHKIDKLDKKLLQALQKDCRNLQEIADNLDTPISTLHYRVKRLEKEGIIKGYSVVLNPEKLDMDVNSIVQVSVKHGPAFEDVGSQIASIKGVWGVYWAFGEVDYFVFTRARNRDEFNMIVRQIMNLDGVTRTNTHVVASVIKEDMHIRV